MTPIVYNFILFHNKRIALPGYPRLAAVGTGPLPFPADDFFSTRSADLFFPFVNLIYDQKSQNIILIQPLYPINTLA